MMLKAELYQSDYAQLRSIHGATFRTDDGRTYDIRTLNGKLSTRGQAVDASAYSIPVYFEIDGQALLPGEFVDVYLRAGEDVPRLVIPVTALTEDLGVVSVYVQSGGERFEKRQIEAGSGDGTFVPVLSGLREGERIVTRGMHAVRLAASAGQVQSHGHAH
jgi:multidrug efflux pump subunit AcrA (membrane-fusion protein)